MSINKAQADALSAGFLNNLGSGKDGLIPRESLSALFLLAGEFVEDCQQNLNEANSNASGSLSKSLVLNDPKQTASLVSVDVLMNFYGQFLNAGVKGTKSGAGKYKFKNNFPSREMIQNLMQGINRAKKSTTNVNRHKSTSANEKKNVKISDIQKAWGAAVNIKMYGIKATGFVDKAVKTTIDKAAERFGKAFEIDILNSLPNKL